jgi:hypothetical protein
MSLILKRKNNIKNKKIPNSIKDHISNAYYYLTGADMISETTHQGIRIFLLLTAWENIQLAEEELDTWAQKTRPTKELYKSHSYKLRKVREFNSIDRIILGPPGTPAQTIKYVTPHQLEQLLQICRYGFKTGTKELSSIFSKGWEVRDFQSSLLTKIIWEETMIKIYEDYFNSQEQSLLAVKLT